MPNDYDYKKFAILYVDDEQMSLSAFSRAFGDDFRILTADNAQDGYQLLETHKDEIGLLMTDQRMPGEKGVWLLERARKLRPRIIRVLATAYSDMDAAIAAVNSGAIYKYVSKPWDPPQLEETLKHGLEFFIVQTERDKLLQEKMSVLRNMLIADRIVSLGLLAAGLSHHIRNSLVAVKTFLDLAPVKMNEEKTDLNSLRNPDFWKDYHSNVQFQIEKINSLLKDLWTASENSTAPFADEVLLHQSIGDALKSLEDQFTARRITIENRIPTMLPKLRVDKPKFQRLFELLLKEELAMLPAGTTVKMAAELVEKEGKQEILVEIGDNGPGLPEDALRAVFDPFAVQGRVASEYGIHLMACYFIIHHHGGKMEARSMPGFGTTFLLRLPLQPERNAVQQPPEESNFLQKALLNQELWEKLVGSDQ
ncbi:MAG TPA: response regulator [Candidatus Acidoferrales bacterium]|jgi:two-component system probable response regulator PhcQ|nr:response regulator [Candidatus Acidoferrales bacterium]